MALVSFSGFSQSKFELSSKESKFKWKGSDVVGGGHEGTLNLQSGSLFVSADGRITKGDFVVEMNSIRAIDEHNENSIEDLDNHLKSDDFFSVAKFPKAFFSIVQVNRATTMEPNQFMVTGLLTIKEITHQITFPSEIIIGQGIAKLKADIVFDGTKWDIIYQSKNFLANLKDVAIADEINISIDLGLAAQSKPK